MTRGRPTIERAFRLLDEHDLDALGEAWAADCEFKVAGVEGRGLAFWRAIVAGWLLAFPDLGHQVRRVIDARQGIAVEVRLSGTHTGALVLGGRVLHASGRRLQLESVQVGRICEGRLASWHIYFDQLAMFAQLGASPTRNGG